MGPSYFRWQGSSKHGPSILVRKYLTRIDAEVLAIYVGVDGEDGSRISRSVASVLSTPQALTSSPSWCIANSCPTLPRHDASHRPCSFRELSERSIYLILAHNIQFLSLVILLHHEAADTRATGPCAHLATFRGTIQYQAIFNLPLPGHEEPGSCTAPAVCLLDTRGFEGEDPVQLFEPECQASRRAQQQHHKGGGA